MPPENKEQQLPREFLWAQLRLKCAEIVFVNGSQLDRSNLEVEAERLFKFATAKK